MTTVVAVGVQWGDEGKGKIVDLLTDQASAVVRFQGPRANGMPELHKLTPYLSSLQDQHVLVLVHD